MRTALIIGVLCSLQPSAHAGKGGKDDTFHTVKRRHLPDGERIEITRHVDRGTTTTTIARPGRFGDQETTWSRDAHGTLTRKTIAGTKMTGESPEHYFLGRSRGEGDLSEVNHTAKQK